VNAAVAAMRRTDGDGAQPAARLKVSPATNYRRLQRSRDNSCISVARLQFTRQTASHFAIHASNSMEINGT
jgi:hypothetical protein